MDDFLGFEGVLINSSLVSYQNRERYYWTNIPFEVLVDRKIYFHENRSRNLQYERQFALNKTPSRLRMWNNGNGTLKNLSACPNVSEAEKIFCLTRKQDRCPNSGLIALDDFCRYLTREEMEMAQNVPIGYTNCLTIRQAEDVLGDGWTVDVISHIFGGLK